MSTTPSPLRQSLHARGYRLTSQRRLVLDAVERLSGATPEQIAQEPALVEAGVNITTVYRSIEVLEELGLISHLHLGHGAPQYEIARHDPHLHLVCHRCGAVADVPGELAATLVSRLGAERGFAVDVAHLTVSGTCSDCRDRMGNPTSRPYAEQNVTSPLLTRPGAVAADPPDDGVASHYGDPVREQRALAGQGAVVDRSNRGVLAVRGPDRLGWLHSLTTQHLERLAPMTGTQALVLSPHGHVEHHLVLADDGETTWLDVEPGRAPALLEFLDSMRFMLRVEVAEVTGDWALLSVAGGGLPARPVEPYAVAELPDGGLVRAMPWPGESAADLLVPRARLEKTVDELGLPLAGLWAYDALRVEERRPRLGAETDHRTIVQEGGWVEAAVHLDKGCYRGQETVARVHNLGRPPRRLVLLHLDGTAEQLPAQGAAVTVDGRPVGFVGTAVRHHELGPIALALVKRQTADDADLLVDGVPAAIDVP